MLKFSGMKGMMKLLRYTCLKAYAYKIFHRILYWEWANLKAAAPFWPDFLVLCQHTWIFQAWFIAINHHAWRLQLCGRQKSCTKNLCLNCEFVYAYIVGSLNFYFIFLGVICNTLLLGLNHIIFISTVTLKKSQGTAVSLLAETLFKVGLLLRCYPTITSSILQCTVTVHLAQLLCINSYIGRCRLKYGRSYISSNLHVNCRQFGEILS
jgi:hypothetical protein